VKKFVTFFLVIFLSLLVTACSHLKTGIGKAEEGTKDVVETAKQTWRKIADFTVDEARNINEADFNMVKYYFSYMEDQVGNNGKTWKKLPEELIDILAPYYRVVQKDGKEIEGEDVLASVRYAEDIDTIHGQTITVVDKIYFVPKPVRNDSSCNEKKRDFKREPCDFCLLLHELTHVKQYLEMGGGTTPFLKKYFAQTIKGTFVFVINTIFGSPKDREKGIVTNIHDSQELEEKADEYARYVFKEVHKEWLDWSEYEDQPKKCSCVSTCQ